MEPLNQENRRRADPVQVILEVQAARFELVGSTDLFFKPDDELRYEVGRKTVRGNTDRFALLFRKPEQ
jgi:predicted methyltransferase